MADKKPKAKKKPKPKTLTTRVTRLEMTGNLKKAFPVPTRPITALMVARNMPAEFYAYLYEQVGRPYHWSDRRNLDPATLYALINHDDCQIGVLYAEGCPAGFYELDLSDKPECVEIRYFGLSADYQGLGLGKWFLAASIQAAWAHKPEKVAVETNTLDHPVALQLYQRMGFSPVSVSDAEIEPWD